MTKDKKMKKISSKIKTEENRDMQKNERNNKAPVLKKEQPEDEYVIRSEQRRNEVFRRMRETFFENKTEEIRAEKKQKL